MINLKDSKLDSSFFSLLDISLAILSPICSCILFTFFIKALKQLIIVILNSLSDNPKICVIYGSHSDACFLFSDSIFSCLLAYIVIFFCQKPDIIFWVMGTEKLSLSVSFVLFWLGII